RRDPSRRRGLSRRRHEGGRRAGYLHRQGMTAQTTIYFVRHGQTDWNAEGRLQGQEDTSLNDLGRSQATGNGERLAELIPDASLFDFVSSPLWRTRETMERVRAAM